MSTDLLKLYECTLSTEDNAYGDSAKPVIEINFYNDYIHILHDMPKKYMYRYFVSRFIS